MSVQTEPRPLTLRPFTSGRLPAPETAPARRPNRYWWWVGAALLAGLAVRLLLATTDDVITNDGTAYLRSGEAIWAGEGFTRDGVAELHFPPLYPTLLGGVEQITGDPHTTIVLTTLVAGTLLLVPLTSIARRAGGDRAGIAAAWIGALATGLTDVISNSGSGNEAVYLLLLLTAFRLAIDLDRLDRRWRTITAALVGVLTGLAYLTRPEGLFYAVLFLAVLFLPLGWRRWRARHTSSPRARTAQEPGEVRARFVAAGALIAGLAGCVVPYASFLYSHTGRVELTAKTRDVSIEAWHAVAAHDRHDRDVILYRLDETGTGFSDERHTFPSLVAGDPIGYLGIVGTNMLVLVEELADPVDRAHLSLGWVLLPLPVTALAVLGAFRRRRDPIVVGTVAALALPVATSLAFFVQARYLIPTTAFLSILAGVGFAELPARWRRPAGATIGVLLVLGLIASWDGAEGWFNRREPVEHRLAGEWLDANTDPDDRIMTRSMIVDYYADRLAVSMPYTDQDTLLDFARHHGVDYLVIDDYNIHSLRPQYLPLLEGPPTTEGVDLVHEFVWNGRGTRIYALDPPPGPGTPDPPRLGFMADQGS